MLVMRLSMSSSILFFLVFSFNIPSCRISISFCSGKPFFQLPNLIFMIVFFLCRLVTINRECFHALPNVIQFFLKAFDFVITAAGPVLSPVLLVLGQYQFSYYLLTLLIRLLCNRLCFCNLFF